MRRRIVAHWARRAWLLSTALTMPLPVEAEMVRESRRRFAMVGGGRLAPGMAQVALAAAGRLDELAEGAGERVFQIGMHTPRSAADGIFASLARAGIDVSRRWAGFAAGIRNWMSTHKDYETALLADLSSLAAPALGPLDDGLWSLTDVGDLLAATGYQKVGTGEFGRAFVHDSTEARRSWLDAIADAYGIDKSAAASQARYLQQMGEGASDTGPVSNDWFVASAMPLAKPSLLTNLNAALTTEQQRVLLACLEADSGWIAWAAADVLVRVNKPLWNSRELFEKDMSSWPLQRSGLMHVVAILTSGDERGPLLARAAGSDSADYRCARTNDDLRSVGSRPRWIAHGGAMPRCRSVGPA